MDIYKQQLFWMNKRVLMGLSASYPHEIYQLLWGYLWVQLWCPIVRWDLGPLY